jgi:hypothetical protein
LYTGPQNRARHYRVRELAAPLGLSELELFSITADLNHAAVDIDEHTVHAAAHGEYSRSRERSAEFANSNPHEQKSSMMRAALPAPW